MIAISIESVQKLINNEVDEIISGQYKYTIQEGMVVALPYDEDSELSAYYDSQFEIVQDKEAVS